MAIDTVSAADEIVSPYKGSIPDKNTKFPKVSRDLLQLQQDYANYQLQPQLKRSGDPFAPQIQIIRTSGGYVVVDAVASGDAAVLHSDLIGLGAVNVVSHTSMVSAVDGTGIIVGVLSDSYDCLGGAVACSKSCTTWPSGLYRQASRPGTPAQGQPDPLG